MKKNIAVIILAVLFSWISVDAASLCSYEKQKELSKLASNVKLTYDEMQGIVDPNEYYVPAGEDPETFEVKYDYFRLKIINITEDIYVKLENSTNEEVKYIEYEDTDEGLFVIDWNDLSKVTTFSFTVYSSTKTECPNEEIRKGVLTIRMLNKNYNNVMCSEMPEHELCQKYTTVDVSESEFRKLASEYLEKKNTKKEKQEQKQEKVEKKNKKIIIITASLVIVAGGVTYVIVRKKRGSHVI